MSCHHQSSTQPYDSAEIEAMLARAREKPGSPSRFREPRPEGSSEATAVIVRPDLDVAAITELFNDASLDAPPDTRLVISFPGQVDLGSSAAVRLPRGFGARGMVGVVQRTQDVHFACSLLVDGPPSDPSNPPIKVTFYVYYDPGTDGCVLRNRTNQDFALSALDAEAMSIRVERKRQRAVDPGLWRLSLVGDGNAAEQHVLDLLILRRRFTVGIREGLAAFSASGKRKAQEELDLANKRRKQTDDVTEILLAPKSKSPAQLSRPTADLAPTLTTASIVSTTADGTPLIHLEDGDTAVVRPGQRGADQTDESAIYELSRLGHIAVTWSASVFTARHTAISEDIVVKVMKYEGKTPEDLIQCARNWAREVRFLENLNHVCAFPHPRFLSDRVVTSYELPGNLSEC